MECAAVVSTSHHRSPLHIYDYTHAWCVSLLHHGFVRSFVNGSSSPEACSSNTGRYDDITPASVADPFGKVGK
jgi:hypothetical protein